MTSGQHVSTLGAVSVHPPTIPPPLGGFHRPLVPSTVVVASANAASVLHSRTGHFPPPLSSSGVTVHVGGRIDTGGVRGTW